MPLPTVTRLDVKNFTVFREASIEFASGLNVIVGDNGTGKTHLLKLLYAITAVSSDQEKNATTTEPRRTALQGAIASKIVNVFRPDEGKLGRLTRRTAGRARAEVAVEYSDKNLNNAFSFATNSRTEVSLNQAPNAWLENTPVYLPTRELLTLFPGFVSLYEGHYLEFDETWRDTCLLLGRPVRRGSPEARVRAIVAPLEEAMNGRIYEENGRFYLRSNGGGNLEAPLVAEGLRKLGMLARLISTGALLDNGILFWDEPEANLNPRSLVILARVIVDLALSGTQMILATHSLFLLREIEMLVTRNLRELEKNIRFIGLHRSEDGFVVPQVSSQLSGVGDITALDESLAQSDRYLNLNSYGS